jgi:hypothetical protein
MQPSCLPVVLSAGPSWQFLSADAGVVLKRNVTIFGKEMRLLDLGYFSSLIRLASGVQLTFSNLILVHQKRTNPLYPGPLHAGVPCMEMSA